jgi:hypothetical protein
MYGITTINKLNRIAAEAATIVSAHTPAAAKPAESAHTTADAIKESRAHAQETIGRILGKH